MQHINYCAFTIHGSVAMPVPEIGVVPEMREMAGRTPVSFEGAM